MMKIYNVKIVKHLFVSIVEISLIEIKLVKKLKMRISKVNKISVIITELIGAKDIANITKCPYCKILI